ncbi:MAG: hypothetical protein MUF29_00500 [Chitinophagaceae bacterium]|nr:hypothetical protein [Chitinophagaceae bacterium]
MKKGFYWLAAGLLLAGCGGASIDPAVYQEEQTAQAASVDEEVGKALSYKSLADFSRGSEKWNVQLGYVSGKPALLKMSAADDRQVKWWIYADTATGQVSFLKEETAGKDGKGVRNLFGYKDTALIFSKSGQTDYAPVDAGDFRMKASEVNKLYQEVKAAVEADRPDLSPAANAARKDNAQFFAAGNEPGWSLVINPSKNQVVLTLNNGADSKNFGFNNPEQGPMGESIYELRSLEENMKVTIASKYCVDASGKVFPYTVAVQYQNKGYTGCGILLQ